MTKLTNDNASLAALRVFETLKCLIQKPSDVNDIIEYLEKLDSSDGKAYSKGVVYKYLTTLKFAGIDIVRQKCRYKVKNLPFKIQLDKENLNSLALLEKILDFTPENELVENLQNLFYNIKIRCDFESIDNRSIEKQITEQFKNHRANDKQIEILRKYEKYCKDKLKLQIEYYNVFNEKCNVICEPLEAKYEDEMVLLNTFCEHPNQYLELNSNQIINIKQTPLSCRSREDNITYSTVFTLKGRLAQRYIPREEEIRMDQGENDEIKTYSNKIESKERLFLRLMRYSESCKINTPKTDREKMKRLIADTLKNYGIDVEKEKSWQVKWTLLI